MAPDVQIILPVRVDSEDRLENLRLLVAYLTRLEYALILSEIDDQPRATPEFLGAPGIACSFQQRPHRHIKAVAVNAGLLLVESPIVAIWDVDCWISRPAVADAVRAVREGLDLTVAGEWAFDLRREAARPLLSRASALGELDEESLKEHVRRRRPLANGGINFARARVLKQIRGVNEQFHGWGGEDDELVERCRKLGYRVGRTGGALWHLDHAPARASRELCLQAANAQYLQRLRAMSPDETRAYYGLGPEAACFEDRLPVPGPEEAVRFWTSRRIVYPWRAVVP